VNDKERGQALRAYSLVLVAEKGENKGLRDEALKRAKLELRDAQRRRRDQVRPTP